jgi:hypothetical protein
MVHGADIAIYYFFLGLICAIVILAPLVYWLKKHNDQWWGDATPVDGVADARRRSDVVAAGRHLRLISGSILLRRHRERMCPKISNDLNDAIFIFDR